MGLEAPWALLGALLAAAPVVAHLARRHDLPRVALPTIALLRRAQVASRRRTRLVDVLLLVARVAMILALALGLAGPYREVKLAWGDGTRASVAIILDDSLSMARDPGGGATPFARALARAREVVRALPAGSEACLIAGGAAPRVIAPRSGDPAALGPRLDALAAAAPTRGTALSAAVALALRELAGSPLEARRILVLSDGAAHARAEQLEAPPGMSLEIERFGPAPDARAPVNRSVAETVVVPEATAAGRATVLVTLRASGGAPTAPVAVRLEQRGRVVARGEARFQGDTASVSLEGPLAGPQDDPTARVVIEGRDALAGDDARGVLLRPPGALRVLLAGDDDATRAAAQALALVPEREGAIAVRRVDADTLPTVALSAFDTVLLAGMPAPGAELAAALRRFVERGGGLVLAAGDPLDARALDAALGPVLPARASEASGTALPPGLRPGDSLPDTAPAAPLRDATGLADVRVTRRLLLETPRRDAVAALRFADGAPALVVGTAGSGRVALLAVPLDESWSDLPLHPGFLPLVARLARGVGPVTRAPAQVVSPGDPITLPLPPGATRLVVTDPSGERETFREGRAAPLRSTTLPGAYRVEVADEGGVLRDAPRLAFVVASPADESDLRPGPGATGGMPRDTRKAASARTRRPLAPWLFLLVGLLALAEGALRFRGARPPAQAAA